MKTIDNFEFIASQAKLINEENYKFHFSSDANLAYVFFYFS